MLTNLIFLGYVDKCPNCGSATEQQLSGFVYATQVKARVMSGSCGHFCPKCPTVIINDEFMRQGMSPSFQYGGTVAIETGYSKTPIMFRTLNGQTPTYILDEDEGLQGIVGSVNLIKHEDAFYINPNSLSMST